MLYLEPLKSVLLAQETSSSEDEEIQTEYKAKYLLLIGTVLLGAQLLHRIDQTSFYQRLAHRYRCTVQSINDALIRNYVNSNLMDWKINIAKIRRLYPENFIQIVSPYWQRVRTKLFKAEAEGALRANLNKIFNDYIIPGDILEIGAGVEEGNKNSYLAQKAPKTLRPNFIFSDIFPPKNRTTPYLRLDATRLSEQLKLLSQSNIVALDFVSELPRSKLHTFAMESYKSLMLNGRVILLSEMLFDIIPLMDKYATSEFIAYPYQSGNKMGVVLFSLQRVKENAKRISEKLDNLIDELMCLTTRQRLNFFLSMSDKNTRFFDLLGGLDGDESYKFVNLREDFSADLESAFRDQAGFQIVTNSYSIKEEFLPGHFQDEYGNSFNSMTVDLRTAQVFRYEWDPKVKHNTCRVTSVFHVFVAKKVS